MATPKLKSAGVLDELKGFYLKDTLIMPAVLQRLKADAAEVAKVDFTAAQVIYGLIAGLEKDKEGVRSRYRISKEREDSFNVNFNFAGAFAKSGQYLEAADALRAAAQKIDLSNVVDLTDLVSQSSYLGCFEIGLMAIHVLEKLNQALPDTVKGYFLGVQEMGLTELQVSTVFALIRKFAAKHKFKIACPSGELMAYEDEPTKVFWVPVLSDLNVKDAVRYQRELNRQLRNLGDVDLRNTVIVLKDALGA